MRRQDMFHGQRAGWRCAAGLGMVALLSACATQQVERWASDGDRPVYQLQGNRMAALEAQVLRLCPEGHEVLQASLRGNRLEEDPSWLGQPITWVSDRFEARGVRARLLVRCQVGSTPSPGGTRKGLETGS